LNNDNYDDDSAIESFTMLSLHMVFSTQFLEAEIEVPEGDVSKKAATLDAFPETHEIGALKRNSTLKKKDLLSLKKEFLFVFNNYCNFV